MSTRVEKKVICEGCQEDILGSVNDTLYKFQGRWLCKECFENDIEQTDTDDLAEMLGVETTTAEDVYENEELMYGGGF